MSKILLQDMVPSKSVKKIKTVTKDTSNLNKTEVKNNNIPPKKSIKETFYKDREDAVYIPETSYNKKGNKKTLWFVAFIAIVFLFFAFSSLFAKAKITVNPKVEHSALNLNLSAFKDGNANKVLPFDLVSISDEESKIITTTEEKEVLEKAKGTVIIYNNFSTASQRLDINTRLEGSNGKIYKTEKAIVVPGMTKKDLSKNIKEDTPGSVEVGVYADIAGPSYNTSPIDFKIVGFKGTPKYTGFYARSKGSISGGLDGIFNFVEDEDKARAEEELKKILQEKLLTKVRDQLPEGYILFQGATIFKTDDLVVEAVSNQKEVPMTLKGTLYGFLFEEDKLTKQIASEVLEEYDGSEMLIPNIRDLRVSISIPVGTLYFENIRNIDFNLSGNADLTWKVNQGNLIQSLKGKSKKDFNRILANFENIDSASLVLRPIWRTTIPENIKDIKIIVNY